MAQIPTKAEVLTWIAENPTQTSKRDIARAFGLKGADRIPLKALLKELEAEGRLQKRRASYRDPDSLPPVSVLEVTGPDADGDLTARPLEWSGTGAEPRILVLPRASDPALGQGDRILARLTATPGEDHAYSARMIRRIGAPSNRLLGIFRAESEGGRVVPIDKSARSEWTIPAGATGGAREGELVEAEQAGPKTRLGLPKGRIVARLGDPSGPKAVSLIAIHQHGIPDRFPDEVVDEAEAQTPAPLGTRTDLRGKPFVTIDPVDARDRDDAVLVEPDGDGFAIWVAIADVAHYVRPGSALDREAKKRGNSTYFPDRVVPMLPDALSGDLCSLHDGVDRAVIAVRMQVDASGTKHAHSFHRALIRSVASLHYDQVQDAIDGDPDAATEPLLDPVLRPLYAAYGALKKARATRQPLELDLPERQIVLSEEGDVLSVDFKDRRDAHRLIEEFMVLANVAAAETLIAKRTPLLFRVHEEPAPEKIDALREVAEASGFTLPKGQVLKTAQLNRLLAQAEGSDAAELVNLSTLRAMTQAYYAPENFGHFGLALRAYAHFTSPIRRYADLVVHRALIAAHGWGKDGLSPQDIEALHDTGEKISATERRSMLAERDTTDRYLAAFLADRVGAAMTGRVSGISRAGVFVKLDETGADVLIPMRNLGADYYHYDRDAQTLMGAESGLEIGLGAPVRLTLAEATPVSGGLIGELIDIGGDAPPRGPAKSRGKPPKRQQRRSAGKAAKTRRKVDRKRKSRN